MLPYNDEYLSYMLQNKKYDALLLKAVEDQPCVKEFSFKKSRFLAFNAGITEATVPIDLFLAITCFGTVSFIMMSISIGLLGLFILGVAGSVGWKNYQKNIKKQDALYTDFKSAICEQLIAKEIYQRNINKLIIRNYKTIETVISKAHQVNKYTDICKQFKKWGADLTLQTQNKTQLLVFSQNKQLQSEVIKLLTGKNVEHSNHFMGRPSPDNETTKTNIESRAIKASLLGFSLTSILFGSFFVCSHYALFAIGLVGAAALLTNPITIGITLGLIVSYAAFYSYKVYQHTIDIQSKKQLTQKIRANTEIILYQNTLLIQSYDNINKIDLQIKNSYDNELTTRTTSGLKKVDGDLKQGAQCASSPIYTPP